MLKLCFIPGDVSDYRSPMIFGRSIDAKLSKSKLSIEGLFDGKMWGIPTVVAAVDVWEVLFGIKFD